VSLSKYGPAKHVGGCFDGRFREGESMAEGSGLETYANHSNSATAASPESGVSAESNGDNAGLKRTLLIIGLAAAAAALAFVIVRATLTRQPSDPTTERIQQLIDEANRLLKQLDDKKPE
jgi:uncharacterized protein HemX